jgi:hypothetical protein
VSGFCKAERRAWTGRSRSASAAPCRPEWCTTSAAPWRPTCVAGTYRQYAYLPEKAAAEAIAFLLSDAAGTALLPCRGRS